MPVKKTINDYKNICGDRGEYILDYIPKNTTLSINGWFCNKCNEIFKASFSNIKNHWCASCGKKKIKLQEYKDICKELGEYILDYIPSGIVIPINGWKCDTCDTIFSATYHNIKTGSWCRKCRLNIKDLNDYKEICKPKGEYILDYIPENTNIKIKGWKCFRCDTMFHNCYDNIREGNWCKKCGHNVKDLNDYKEICKPKGEYILDYIPENTHCCVLGWKCKLCETVFESSYKYICRGNWCKKCGHDIKDLNDYKEICKLKGEYILDYIPKNTDYIIEGWKCKLCENIFESSYSRVRYGNWCPPCSHSQSEKLVRSFIEKYLCVKFNSCYPKWLNGLQLDGYNEELCLAFEYQGKQHEEFVYFFHRTEENFEKQKERDKRKLDICQQKCVNLIIIPHTVNYLKPDLLEEYVLNELVKLEYIIIV